MFSSILGHIGHPFYSACAWILAGFFALVPNFAVAIALLTLVIMTVVFPITLRGTRAMLRLQTLSPEIKRLRAKYKVQPEMTAVQQQEVQQRQRVELTALYKEHEVSPVGGCLPLILQFPIFVILYGTIRGLVHQVVRHGVPRPDPLYVGHGTRIFKAIGAAHGQLISFGVNLADSVRTPGLAWGSRVPLLALVLVAIALQYVYMKRMNDRSPAGAVAREPAQWLQKALPLLLAVIYISVPAGVTVYFIVSSLCRIAQQHAMYGHDPHIRTSVEILRAQSGSG
jgi:YidC/Oxa1 family membrane protein insertase